MMTSPDIADVATALLGKKVLITGANGFIGGRLLERLYLECGAKPRALLRSYAKAARIARFGLENIETCIGSLANPETIAPAVEGCSVVFHCAYDRADMKSNAAGMNALIEACIKYGARLVHVSTFGIYEPLPDGDLVEGTKPVRSGIPYSETKLDVEELVLDAVRNRGLDATIVMPTIVFGPFGKGWTLFPATQLSTGTVLLPEEGKGLCNAVFVDDVCQCLIRASVVPEARGQRYFVSGEQPVTWGAYFNTISDGLGLPPPSLMSSAEVNKKSTNPISAVHLLLGDPKRIMRLGFVRSLGMIVKDRLSPAGKAKLKSLYGLYRRVAPKPVYTPSPQQMALFSAHCNVRIDKAKSELHYRPAFDFSSGMQVTTSWLKYALQTND